MAVRLFFASLIVLLVFLGCGGGGGGGGSGSGLLPGAPVVVSGTISGTILIDQAISSLRSEVSSFSPSLRFLDSFVMIEELPNVSTRADQEGKFVFENIPFGTYRIIARVTSLSGRVYKLRTVAQSISQADPQKNVAVNVTQTDLAENQIRMLIKDLNGNPVGKCKVWFWGEQFTLDIGSYYLSPYMPAGAAGVIRVEPPADKQLSGLQFNIPATTFNPDNIEIIGITLPTAQITNKAPIVSITTGKYPEEGSAFLRLFGHYSDPEGEPMDTAWLTNVSTFTCIARDYADWAVPSVSASVTVYFSASEIGRSYPNLTSLANLNINVASSGEVSFPGEILLRPVSRTVDIVGSSTTQIPGNTVAMYEAKPKFPPGLALSYFWTVDRGTIISSATESILAWRSPALNAGVTQLASITLAVTDGIGTASKQIQVRVTSAPVVAITQPTATAFEPGLIVFAGAARDYLNTVISPDSMRWYVATDTDPLILGQTGGATFTWKFLSQGSYTVALEAHDSNGIIGTGTKEIRIINGRPVCVIAQPLNDASFMSNTPITFTGTANDLEDGPITDATALTWISDIDGVIGSGTSFTVASLTSSRHEIRFSATDSGGAVGSTSIVIWYDVPARISFMPADRAVFFTGYNIPFSAVGTDTDNTPLDSSQFKWYFDNLPDIWREGASFNVTAGAYVPGAHSVRVEGPSRFGTAVSPTHAIQMGWPVASITSPASGTRFDPLDVVSFTAVPDSTGTLSLQWYLNNEVASFGSGAIANYAPSNGAHRVTYIGTDSQGIVSSSTVNIVVERIPIVSFFPVAGSYLFTGRPVEFSATCRDSGNNDIANDRVSWLLDGNPWAFAHGKDFSVAQPAPLAAGAYQITLIATGPYGTVGSRTNTITTGVPVASIITPANNQTFAPGANINFSGVPDSTGTILMEWWSNFGLPGATKLGDGDSINHTLPDGYHYISYLGTDSSSFASSHTIRIGVGEFPEMDFTPASGTVFFARQDVVFTGVGTDSIDGTVSANRMAWYIDGALELASYSVMKITPARISVLESGLKEVELRGYNTLGAVGKTVKKIYLGVPNVLITAPLNDDVIPTATPYTLTAMPDSVTGAEITEDLTMEWWLNPGSIKIGEGPSLTYTLPDGIQYLTYLGTDSQGVVSSSTIRVIVSDSPAISFTPANGAQLFVEQPFNLVIGGAVEPASVKWSRDGGATIWKSVSPATVAVGELSVGSSNITAEGESLLGVAASITNSIYYGVELASITAPASGSIYPISAPQVTFSAEPVPSPPYINMRWYRDDGGGSVFMGDSASLANYVMPPGRHTITYVGTDSANFLSSSSIQILINDQPPLEINPGNNSIFFADRTVTFTGSGTSVISGQPVAGSTMKWTISDGSDITASSTTSYGILNQPPLYPAVRKLTLQGTDDLETSNTFGPIDVAFGYPVASITSPASGTRYNNSGPVDTISFNGYPDDGAISMQWYLDAEIVPFHTGPNVNVLADAWPTGIRTIRYEGTDASGFVSSATTQILINNEPSVAILLPELSPPANNLVFYSGRPVNFTATGTTASGNNVETFSWYINGSAVANYTGASINIPANTLSVAGSPHSIRLEATDEYGIKNDVTVSIWFCSLPAISTPNPGDRFASGSAVLFEGSPDSQTNLTMEWWYDYASGGALLGADTPFTSAVNAIPYGSRTITYLGTDSSGFVGSASIQIIMANLPTMKITPSGGAFFSRPVVLSGSGTSAIGEPIASSTFRWYVDGGLRAALNGQANPTFNVVDISAGNRAITLRGEDIYGAQAEADASFYFRYDNPSIQAPANGATVDHALPVTLQSQPDSYMPDIQLQWYDNGVSLNRFGASPATVVLARGLHTIEYSATDSGNVWSSATVNILANKAPAVNFSPPNVPRYFINRPVTLYGYGSNTKMIPESVGTFSWKIVNSKGTFTYSGTNPVINSANLSEFPLLNEVTVTGTDDLGTVGSTTRSIVYGVPLALVTAPFNGNVYPSNSNTINCGAVPAPSSPEITTQWYLNDVLIATGTNTDSITFTNLPIASYTIRYEASDSSGSYTSSSSVKITVNDTPALEILALKNDAALSPFYFVGQPAMFIGSGTSKAGVTIDPANNMKWYVNGGSLVYTGSPATLTAHLTPGLNIVRVTATDTLNELAEANTSVRFAFSHVSISEPLSGVTLSTHAATNVSFTGSLPPDPPHAFMPDWHNVTGAPVYLGSGASISGVSLANGWNTIRYLATDSAGFVSSATVNVLVNNVPTLNITPGNNSIFFTGRPIDLEGSGTSNPGGVPVATFSWYVNGNFRGNMPNITLVTAWLNLGNNTITIEGTDDFGTVGTYSQNIYYGYAQPSISQPASGTVFLSTDNINFVATPAAMLEATPEWWIDGIKASSLSSFISPPLATGVKVVEYIATDSSFATTGFIGSSTINIRVSARPQMTFSPASNSYFFAGHPVTFTGIGTSSEGLSILSASMSWYLNVSAIPILNSPASVLAASLNPGVNTMILRGTDAYGTIGEVTANNLFYGVPTVSITSPSMNDQFPSPNPDVSFVGSPDLMSPYGLTAAWYHIAGSGADPVTPFGTGSSSGKILNDGWHTMRYVATDSAGTISSATVTILVNNAPTVNFTSPASNSVFFAGGNFTLESLPLGLSGYKWYRDAGVLLKNGAPATVLAGDLTVGTHTLYVSGVDGFGTVGTSMVKAIYYGHPLLTISSPPAFGTRISSTDPAVNLTGTVASSTISLSWKINSIVVTGENTNTLANVYPRLDPGWNTITYIGTDSANNQASHSIMLLKNDLPTMKVLPGNGSRFFANTAVVFTNDNSLGGDGSTPILDVNMNWYLDGAVSPTRPAIDTANFSVGQLTTLGHTLRFSGTDHYGTTGTATINFYYGHPVASISSPASGSRVDINSSLSFDGNSNSVGSITMEWYRHPDVASYLGSGIHIGPIAFDDRGYQTITYIGTDSAGFESSSTIQILVNTPPTMTIASPTAGGKYFGGQSLYFEGSGNDSSPGPLVDPASVSWYIDNGFKGADFNYTAPIDQLPTGTRTIRFEGKDSFGTIGSVTRNIETGFALPKITIPASGTRFYQGQLATFTGTPTLTGKIPMTWYWVEGGVPLEGGAPLSPTAASDTLKRGWQTIRYIGSDSAGTERFDSIMVLVASPPTFIVPATITAPLVFGYGPEYGAPGNRIPIHLVSQSNYNLTLSASATNGNLVAIDGDSLTWYLGSTYIGTGDSIVCNFNTPGSFTVAVSATDDYGLVATSSLTFWVWEREEYTGFSEPAAITARSTSELVVADVGENSVLKLTRSTTTVSTTRGDITGVATQTVAADLAGYTLIDFALAGSNIYTLSSSSTAGLEYKFTEWKFADFTFAKDIATVSHGLGENSLSNPLGLSVESGQAIYVSDTDNNLIKKMDLEGTFFLNSPTVGAPIGINYVDANNVYVAVSGDDKLRKFTSELNSGAAWSSAVNATNATRFAKAASNNMYVTDPFDSKINVIDGSGDPLYSFGSSTYFTTPYGITIIGDVNGYDMYITDRTEGKIIRFRSNAW